VNVHLCRRTKDVNVNGHRVTVRYNDTCHFYQPPRAHHCSVNDNCIERFDHHCPWVGTTIGKVCRSNAAGPLVLLLSGSVVAGLQWLTGHVRPAAFKHLGS
jgi:hypothetical protein